MYFSEIYLNCTYTESKVQIQYIWHVLVLNLLIEIYLNVKLFKYMACSC